jgi:predicted ester cyclase
VTVRAHEVTAASVAAFNNHDLEWLRSLYRADIVLEAPGGVRLEGADAAVDYTRRWQQAFRDSYMRVTTEIVDGDRAALRFVIEGTHEDTLIGSLGDVPATHRRIAVDGVTLVRIVDHAIGELSLWFDRTQIANQLGIAPELVVSA